MPLGVSFVRAVSLHDNNLIAEWIIFIVSNNYGMSRYHDIIMRNALRDGSLFMGMTGSDNNY